MLVGPPCLNLTTPPPSYSSHQQAAKDYESVLAEEVYSAVQGKEQPWFRIRKVLWGLQATCTSCFLGLKNIIKRTIYSLPLPKFYLISFVYVWTILYVCLTSVWNSKRWNKNKKALQRGLKKKQYVGGILITSFELPVLSCSQLLKITGFKNTILQCSSSRPV